MPVRQLPWNSFLSLVEDQNNIVQQFSFSNQENKHVILILVNQMLLEHFYSGSFTQYFAYTSLLIHHMWLVLVLTHFQGEEFEAHRD
jgi:hypothetical protein